MRRLLPLSALRAFEAAARHGSFKQAASELAVSPTAISHQIRALEATTGQALFERQVRRVSLTEAGAQLYPVLRAGFDAFESTLQGLTTQAARRPLVISATNAFTAHWLSARIARLRQLHPHIDLELQSSDLPVALGIEGADLAIRYGRGPYPGMASIALFSDSYAPVASPALGARAWGSLPLIEFKWTRAHPLNPTWDNWFAAAGIARSVDAGRLRFSDESAAIQAALSGQGVALLSLELLSDELQAGRLVRVAGPSIPGHTFHLLRSRAETGLLDVDAVHAWLVAEARRAR